MPELIGTNTHVNLTAAFARESQTSQRYLWFAQQADIEGRPVEAALFRSVADGEIGHAHGMLEFLADVGDPLTGEPIGDTADNLRAAIAGELDDATCHYSEFAQAARDEGFDQIADWFDTLARAEHAHLDRFRQALDGPG